VRIELNSRSPDRNHNNQVAARGDDSLKFAQRAAVAFGIQGIAVPP
jgi:hypothetical protein